MRGWLRDALRTAAALWYWNLRKTIHILRGRRGPAPCQHPSDSGRAFETACEASLSWNDRARFARRVCPLLVRDASGRWVCSVDAAKVRPFWGRTFAYYGGGAVVLAGLLGTLTFGGMRAIGYKTTLRQVFWPPAWEELRDVRADYFVRKAEALIAKGNARAAGLALASAHEANPRSYAIGMTLAQYYLVWRRDLVDRAYEDLLTQHPAHRVETANAWLHSLLARGEIEDVAKLARRELAAKSGDPTPWTHALIFAARLLAKPDLLEAGDEIPPPARDVLALEARSQRLPESEARRLLFGGGRPGRFGYANYARVDRLIALGDTTEALVLLRNARGTMEGRDVARFALAAEAVAGSDATREREARALLASAQPAAIGLVALHLIKYPDREMLEACVAALRRAAGAPIEARADAIVAVYFAAVCGGEWDLLPELRGLVAQTHRSNASTLMNFENATRQKGGAAAMMAVIPLVQPMSLELNYALLEEVQALRTKHGDKQESPARS